MPAHLEYMSENYPHANHYTWAYRINEAHLRASDNGEPQGTAGLPMLNILSREGWEETLVVVVRYFGGIKLGRGGLVHAYQKSAQLALEATTPGVLQSVQSRVITIEYASYDRVMRALEPLVLDHQAQFAADVQIALTLLALNATAVDQALDREARGAWRLDSQKEQQALMPLNARSE